MQLNQYFQGGTTSKTHFSFFTTQNSESLKNGCTDVYKFVHMLLCISLTSLSEPPLSYNVKCNSWQIHNFN